STISPTPQGWDQLREYNGQPGQKSAAHPYNHPLNLCSGATGTKYLCEPGFNGTFVKNLRRRQSDGVTPIAEPMNKWRHSHYDGGWAPFHVVSTLPRRGAFAPGASDLDKTSYVSWEMRNHGALAYGFGLPAGCRTIGQCIDGRYFHDSFFPDFAQNGEIRRRDIIDHTDFAINAAWVDAGQVSTGYSRDYARLWADCLIAIFAQGWQMTPQAEALLVRMMAYGMTLRGLYRRGQQSRTGYLHKGGAGQNNGHKMIAMVFSALFRQVPGVYDDLHKLHAGCTNQMFWVKPNVVGLSTSYPGNHSVNQATFHEEHVDRPHFFVKSVDRAPVPDPAMDAGPDADYEFTMGLAGFPEMLCCMLIKQGPNGWDGAQMISRNAGWGPGNFWSASIAYWDRYATFTDGVYLLNRWDTRFKAAWDALRGQSSAPIYVCTPDAFTPWKNLTTYVTSLDGGFEVDLRAANHTTAPITECRMWYSFDGAQWFAIDPAQALSGVSIEILDAVSVLAALFLGERQPAEPSGACGFDLTADELGCGS
ncbi:MAG: hypothetical protein AAB263_01435, partial [Planctomycetota bacterium]